MKITLPELPDLNSYIKAERANKYAAASIKKKATEAVALHLIGCIHLDRVYLKITYFCKDKRKDKDNIAFAKKFIFDGMIKAGVIKNDNWITIKGWEETFAIDKKNPRIEVEII